MENSDDALDFQTKTLVDSLRAAFFEFDCTPEQESSISFMRSIWAYHLRMREMCFDECCRIIRRTEESMISSESNLDTDTIQTLSGAFQAAIQKNRSPSRSKAGN